MYFVNKRSLGLAIVLLSVLLVICIQRTEASSVKEESYVPANLEAGNNNKNQAQHNKLHRHDHKNDILKKNTEIIYGQDDDDDDDEESGEAVANNAAEALATSSPSSVVALSSQAPLAPRPNQLDGSEFGLGFKNQNDKKSSSHVEDDDDDDYEKELLRWYGSQRYPQQYGSGSQQEDDDDDDDSEVNSFLDAVAQEMAYDDYSKLSEESKEELNPEEVARLLKLLQRGQQEQDSDEIDSVRGSSQPEVKSIKPVNLVDVSENLMQESDYNRQLIKKEQNLETLDESMMPAAEVINSQSIKGNPSLALKQASHHQQDDLDRVDLLRKQNDYLFIFIVGGCVFAGLVALIAASVCWYTVHKSSKTIILTEYGMKGGSASNLGGSKISLNSGDRRLAQSAQMYHYQHQKQQMIAMEKANNDTKPDNQSDSEGETEEGDYTVYECPGLAPTGEMEVKNPLFKEEFSSNNLQAAAAASATLTAPPAYSSVLGTTNEDQLIQIDQATSVITVNETVNKQQSTEQPSQQQN